MGLMQSWSFASRAVDQLFDLDWITSVPAKCFSASKFFDRSYYTISVGKEHTFVDVSAYFRPSSALCAPTPHAYSMLHSAFYLFTETKNP